jgi:hypothetical protein
LLFRARPTAGRTATGTITARGAAATYFHE